MKPHITNILERAEKIQRLLAKRVEIRPLGFKPKRIGGVDLAYIGDLGIVSYVETEYGGEKPILKYTEVVRITVPYIPTFLFLREGPPILHLINTHKINADVIMVNGHGLTHPRRMGLATYIGVTAGIPTIGIAKKPLYGALSRPMAPDIWVVSVEGEEVGAKIKTRHGGHIYISIGNKITLEETVRIVLDNLGSHRLPIPLYHADKLSKQTKKLGQTLRRAKQ